MIEENVWSNPQMKQFAAEIGDPGISADMFDLVKALSQVMERLQSRPIYEISDESVSVSDMVAHLRALLSEYPPSSPSMALFRDGKPVYMIHRSEIERREPAEIAALLTEAFDRFCSTPALNRV